MAYKTHKFEDCQVLGAQQLNEMDAELARQKSWEELGDRPFYEESGLVEVLAETTPVYNEDEGAYVIETAPNIIIAETYVVNWNGTEYSCLAQDASALNPGDVVLGNGSEFGLPGNGEPFFIDITNGFGLIVPLDESSSPVVSIKHKTTRIKTIDPKYIKDMYYENVEETTGPLNISWDGNVGTREYYVLMQEGSNELGVCKVSDAVLTVEDLTGGTLTLETPEGTQRIPINADGAPATELIDVIGVEGAGIIMEGEMPLVVSFPEDCVALGAQVTKGTYFMLMKESGVQVYTSNVANPSAIVTERKEAIKTIDPKYIKDMYYQEGGMVRIDPSTMDLSTLVTSSDGKFYRVSELTPSVDEFLTWYVETMGARVTVAQYENVAGGTISDQSDSLYSFGFQNVFIVLSDGAAYGDRVFPKAGVYMIDSNMDGGLVFEGNNIVIHKIPSKYIELPDSVMTQAYELPNTANGFSILMADIRDAWETNGAVSVIYNGVYYSVLGFDCDLYDGMSTFLLARALNHLPKGAPADFSLYTLRYDSYASGLSAVLKPVLNRKELYLDSSTANSTKRFKITVDDSGTLSATEVTA